MMGGRWRLATLVFILFATGNGCRSARPIAMELADAFCGVAWRCCSAGELALYLGPYVTEQDCAERMVGSFDLAQWTTLSLGSFGGLALTVPNLAVLDRAIRRGDTRLNRDALDACIEFLRQLQCNVPEAPPEPGTCIPPVTPPDDPCDPERIFEGRLKEGKPCSSPGTTLECRPGLICRTNDALGVTGVCVDAADLDEICFTGEECLPELYCSQLDGTCQRPTGEGGVCLFSDPEDSTPPLETLLLRCEEGLACDPITDTCVVACSFGATCITDLECDEEAGVTCIFGRCDFPHGLDAPCASDDDCEETLRCAAASSPMDLRCQERLADGLPCLVNSDCLSGYCDDLAGQCAGQDPPGTVCTENAQCSGGFCDMTVIPCTMPSECAASCDTTLGRCDPVCLPLLGEGEVCGADVACSSGACVLGFCRILPLPDGAECDDDSQCGSEYCNLFVMPGVCQATPLADGEPCLTDDQCLSGVCWAEAGNQETCVPGGQAEEPCNDPMLPPCDPVLTYCELLASPVVCTPYRETGAACVNDDQCRGSCVLAFKRMVCDETTLPDAAVCDGI